MKNSRFALRMLIPLAVLFSMALTLVYASNKSTSQLPNNLQAPDKSSHAITWKPTTMPIKSSESSVDVNLRALDEKANWIIGVVPVETGGHEEITVSRVRWEDSGASKIYRFERIAQADGYPSELIDVATGAVSITGSESLSHEDTSLVICLKVGPGTKVNLLQDGEQKAVASKALQSGFAVRNGKQIGTPSSSLPMFLAQVQTDRLRETSGLRVIIDQSKSDSQPSAAPPTPDETCTLSGTMVVNGNCIDIDATIACDNGWTCSVQIGGCVWGNVSAVYMVVLCSQS